MNVKDILFSEFVDDKTIITIRNNHFEFLAKGNWYQDHILDYKAHKAEAFSWQDDNHIFITIKN